MPYKNLHDKLQYAKTTFKRVPFDVRRDYFDTVLRPAADKAGEPVNTFIKKAIDERIDRLNQ